MQTKDITGYTKHAKLGCLGLRLKMKLLIKLNISIDLNHHPIMIIDYGSTLSSSPPPPGKNIVKIAIIFISRL